MIVTLRIIIPIAAFILVPFCVLGCTRVALSTIPDSDDSPEDSLNDPETPNEKKKKKIIIANLNIQRVCIQGSNISPQRLLGPFEFVMTMIRKKMKWEIIELPDNLSCAICLQPYKNKELICRSKNPECENHIFHLNCALQWLEKSDECALCRGKYINFE